MGRGLAAGPQGLRGPGHRAGELTGLADRLDVRGRGDPQGSGPRVAWPRSNGPRAVRILSPSPVKCCAMWQRRLQATTSSGDLEVADVLNYLVGPAWPERFDTGPPSDLRPWRRGRRAGGGAGLQRLGTAFGFQPAGPVSHSHRKPSSADNAQQEVVASRIASRGGSSWLAPGFEPGKTQLGPRLAPQSPDL